MPVDVFKWCTQVNSSGGSMTTANNIRSISMGNGYRQVASSGRNVSRRDFSIVYGGRAWSEVLDFVNAHITKPFIWTPPDGKAGVFIVKADSVTMTPVFKNKIHEVKCTFTEQFTSA